MMPLDLHETKSFARALRVALAPHAELSHGQVLDVLARASGVRDWNALSAALQLPSLGAPMPVLRVLDASVALAFYVGWLGFEVEFEHRFEPGSPLFVAVRMGATRLGLSEHHGDGTAGSVVWIPARALQVYRDGLVSSPNASQRPGIDLEAPGGPTMTVIDPYGNVLRFCEPRLS